MKSRLLALAALAALAACDRGGGNRYLASSFERRMEDASDAHKAGRLDEAQAVYEAALKEAEATGREDLKVATVLNNLASLHKDAARLEQAAPLYERAIVLMEKAYGPEHHDLAVVLGNLASLRDLQERRAEAEKLRARAEAIRVKLAGKPIEGSR